MKAILCYHNQQGRKQTVLASSRSVRGNHKIEAFRFGERPEVPVSREQRNPAINTALGDQGIAEAGLTALCQHVRPQRAGPLPIARPDLDQRQL